MAEAQADFNPPWMSRHYIFICAHYLTIYLMPLYSLKRHYCYIYLHEYEQIHRNTPNSSAASGHTSLSSLCMPPCSTCGRYNSSCTVLCTRLLNRLHNLAVLVEQLHNVTLTYPLAPGCPPLPSCTRSPLHHTTLTPHFQLASPHWEHPNLNNTVLIVEYWVMLSEYRVCVQHTGVLSCWKHNNDWAITVTTTRAPRESVHFGNGRRRM